ncbi:hypothetical protein GTU73_14625 [Rathayibacter sp. VKM Ac-2804]|uniref:hypothetical protein n=1 Tax=Rathayibacter sp. VKM Ac-2804 TaxID=2609257 RepID=UPI00132ED9FE|nr:hypothetical protein [Rathayibacter sp. VKM Ac-2804]QHF25113.1 hypothetical protein GTU73_14625 [Rathayibacter sp. VKM Ac-2804]
MPITSSVKPEPRTPATQAEDGATGGRFARGVREDFGADEPGFVPGRLEPLVVEPVVEPGFFDADGFDAPGAAAADVEAAGFEVDEAGVSAAAGRRGALPGAEGRRGGRAMGGCLLERWNG